MSTIVVTIPISHNDIPDKASNLLQFFADKIAEIPKEYRDDATVEKDLGDHWFDLDLKYRRPETPEEAKLRLQNQARYAATTEQRERREFERLKAKYEPAPPAPEPHTITFL